MTHCPPLARHCQGGGNANLNLSRHLSAIRHVGGKGCRGPRPDCGAVILWVFMGIFVGMPGCPG